MKKWFVYIVECYNGTFYTGITTNINKRISTHNKGVGAKYTRSRLPVLLNRDEKENFSKKPHYMFKNKL